MKTDGPTACGPRASFAFLFLELGVVVAAWFSLSGWVLSFAGHLDRGGYLVSVALGVIALGLWLRSQDFPTRSVFRGWRRRVRQPLPALFLLIFALAALGGALYHPNNYDALTYRLPPVLHWLEAHRWHWIATSNELFNLNSPGFGWWMAPLLVFTHSDRGFFLLNIAAFAFLPGLFFSVLRGCGVRGRVAWFWMWLLPAGYCFATQAGGIGNDLLPAVYLLAAVALALRAGKLGRVSDLWISALAAALATGVKIIPAPLILVWLVAVAPTRRMLARQWPGTLLAATVAAAISFLPTAILNIRHTGDWSGDPTNFYRIRLDHPLYGVAGNIVELAVTNIAPPIWPAAGATNRALEHVRDGELGRKLLEHYPRFGIVWGEIAIEESSGLGLGLCALAVLIPIAGLIGGGWVRHDGREHGFWIGLAVGAAFLAFCAKMGSESAPRLAASYYPFLLIPLLRRPVNDRLTRRRWWRGLTVLAAASIVPALILTPARPLWPAQRVLDYLAAKMPGNVTLQRARLVYAVYATRHDHLGPLRQYLPAGARTVGFIPTGNDLESSLWKPYGSRRVVEVLTPSPTDPALAQLRGSAIVTSRRALAESFHLTPEAYAATIGGRIAGRATLAQKAAIGPEGWLVIALDAPIAKPTFP